jgi:hypothetical protein
VPVRQERPSGKLGRPTRLKLLVLGLLGLAAVTALVVGVLREPAVDPLQGVHARGGEARTAEEEARIKSAVEARIRANADGRTRRAITGVVVQGSEVTLIARHAAVEHESGRRAPTPEGLCRLPLARGSTDPADKTPGVTEIFVHFADGELWACSHVLSL